MSLNAVKILFMRDEKNMSLSKIAEALGISVKEVAAGYTEAQRAKKYFDAREKRKVVYRKRHIVKKPGKNIIPEQKMNDLLAKFGEKK